MAAKKTMNDEMLEETIKETMENDDPWTEENYEEVFVPKRTRGEQTSEIYMVNGNKYTVPKGKSVKVPRPIAELVRRHEEQIQRTMEEAEKAFTGQATPNMNVNTTRNI